METLEEEAEVILASASMDETSGLEAIKLATTARNQSTFDSKGSFLVNEPVGSATISPAGRDVALASYVQHSLYA